MQISEARVEEFIKLYTKKYGKTIYNAQARVELTAIVCLLEAIYKHNNKNNYDKRDQKVLST